MNDHDLPITLEYSGPFSLSICWEPLTKNDQEIFPLNGDWVLVAYFNNEKRHDCTKAAFVDLVRLQIDAFDVKEEKKELYLYQIATEPTTDIYYFDNICGEFTHYFPLSIITRKPDEIQ